MLNPVNVEVTSDVKVMIKPPELDVLLLRRTEPRWTPAQKARLADGIRHNDASHVLIEFKYTESLSETIIQKALSYDILYKEYREVDSKMAQSYIVSSKTPQTAFLNEFGYQPGQWPGVMYSKLPMMRLLPLIILNDLSDDPHNLAFKVFASRQKQRIKAIQELFRRKDDLNFDYNVVSGLFHLWTNKELDMATIELSNKAVIEMGKKFGKEYVQMLPAEERMKGLSSDEVLEHLSPDEVFNHFSPDEVLNHLNPDEVFNHFSLEDAISHYSPDEIKAYLAKMESKR